MTFLDRALPYAKLGIPVFPLEPREKVPAHGLKWDSECTTDPAKIKVWNHLNPDYNCGLVATPEGVFFLEFDQGSLEEEAQHVGVKVPETRVHLSGKNGKHWVFIHNDRSREIGNRSAVANGEEWFSMRADTKYVVAPGSIHPITGKEYIIINDALPVEAPDWVLDFVQSNTIRAAKSKDTVPVTDNFDFDDLMDFFEIPIRATKDDVWQICDVCPIAGYRHEQSKLTAFYWDGNSLGFSCFASSCESNTGGKNAKMTIGEVIAHLNKKNGDSYRGEIWSSDGIDFDDPRFEIEEAELGVVESLAQWLQSPAPAPCTVSDACAETTSEDRMNAMVALLAPPEPLPFPETVVILDPDKREGLEFPGDCAMYGRLREIALKHPRLQLGWFYPSLLAVASALAIEDVDHNVRSNLYVANLGDVGYGKTVCSDTAARSIFIPGSDIAIMEETPSSDRGLANMLGEEDTSGRLLLSDEFRSVLQKCAIQGSALPQMLCQLWSKDKAGVADKKGKQTCYAKLSILGNIACKDPSEFAKMFGSNTVSGMADRFLFGYSTTLVKYRPPQPKLEIFDNLKPVRMPIWVWAAKDEWADQNPEARRRLGEHALRIALVTAALEGDREITKQCFEAALRFMEWQERIREIYRPGLAETKEAEAYESVYTALWERLKKQTSEGSAPKGAEEITKDNQEQCKLLHFAQVVNGKSYYRKYAGLIDRVKKSMIDNGVIGEIREYNTDDHGNEKKGKKTPFVTLRGRIK